MPALDVAELSQAVCDADRDAAEKCKDIEGRDVVVFIGCTGAGKTTISAYALGSSFALAGRELREETPAREGFTIGADRKAVTRGVAFAEVPNTGGLRLADLAGTGDTAGAEADLCGAIYRTSVLQAAGSVRIVLVLNVARAAVSNDRGKHVIRDLEHVAGLFKEDVGGHCKSIGMVLTSGPTTLASSEVMLNGLWEIKDALGKLADDVVVPAEGSCNREGMKTTEGGLALLRYFCEQCQDACDAAEEITEGDDADILRHWVSKQCAIFPANVLQKDQQPLLQQFLKGLTPIASPAGALTCALPHECKTELESSLGSEFVAVQTSIRDQGQNWASDDKLTSGVVTLLELSTVLEHRHLLSLPRTELCATLLDQNKAVAEHLFEGVVRGNPAKVEGAMAALRAMDPFRKEVQHIDVRLQGWFFSKAAVLQGADKARETLHTHLPEGWGGAHWDKARARMVCDVLRATGALEDAGKDVLAEYAAELVEHVQCLKGQAGACVDAGSAVTALTRLDAHRTYLRDIIKCLSKHGCQQLDGDGINRCVDEAKAAVLEQLKTLSERTIKERQQSEKSASHETLQQLCRSTELGAFLDEDLYDTFLVRPLASAFTPSQGEIDSLVTLIQSEPPDQWCSELSELARRINDVGDLGQQVLEAANLNLGGLLDLLRDQVASAKALVKSAASSAHCASPVVSGRCSSAVSEDDEPSLGYEAADEAEDALEKLGHCLPADSLVRLCGRPGTDTAAVALSSAGWALADTLRKCLKEAERANGNTRGPAAMETEVPSVMYRMKGLLPLARSTVKRLQSMNKPEPRDRLSGLATDADAFIQGFVKKAVDAWAAATTDGRGWLEDFQSHLRMAERLRRLRPADVAQAEQGLVLQVRAWQETCFQAAEQAARAAAEHDADWQSFIEHAVCKGLRFEMTPLREQLRGPARTSFRQLVEAQAEKWRQEAELAQHSGKLRAWKKLKALSTSLQRLRGGREDHGLADLLRNLEAALEPLDAALDDTEARFYKAVEEERYPEACRFLDGSQDSARHRELLKERLAEAMEAALQRLDDDGEVEDVKANARRVHDLIHGAEKLQDAGVAEHVHGLLGKLQEGLRRKAADATDTLQLALEGERPPTRALRVCAAWCGKSQAATAEGAFRQFISKQKRALPGMSRDGLVGWILLQDRARGDAPEELRVGTSAYNELIKDFLKHFKNSFMSDLGRFHNFQETRQWGQARRLHGELRDTIDDVFELDVLRPSKGSLRPLKSQLGVGGASRTKHAKDEIKRGEFTLAISSLVTGDCKDTEEELCEAINAELARNMNPLHGDGTRLHERLSTLESFLGAVGEDPPDELKSIAREVRGVCERTAPQVEEQARAAVESGLEAATGTGPDLAQLASTLAQFHRFEGRAPEDSRRQLGDAVRAFWGNVQRAVQKVGGNIRSLEVQPLSLNLKPLRNWLQSFSSLGAEERRLVLSYLHDGAADLQAWMKQLLAEPLEALVDASQIHCGMEALRFGDVGRRCKIASVLHSVLGSSCVDVGAIQRWVSHKKEETMQALSNGPDMPSFNSGYKALKSVGSELGSELPELRMAEILAEVSTALRETELNAHLQRLAGATTVQEALEHIVDLRSVANQAPDTYEEVVSHVKLALSHLQKSPAFGMRGMTALGAHLGQHPVGQLVIAENTEIFGAARDLQNNATFRRAGELAQRHDVVARLKRNSRLGDGEYLELLSALKHYEALLGQLRAKYLLQGKPIEWVMRAAREDLDEAVKRSPDDPNHGLDVLTHLAACYTVVACGKEFIDAPACEQQDRLRTPHRAQMLTIFRLLRVHKRGASKHALHFWRWLTGRQPSGVPENHLAQVLTGEGKCLTLGLLASFLALHGTESDVVCYRKLLTEQDRHAMLPLYAFVGVEDKIRYVTFDEICAERLSTFRDASKELMETRQTPQAHQVRDVSKRVLLIDEVDVFFGRRFYGQIWYGGFKLDSTEAAKLVRFIFDQKRLGQPVTDIESATCFTDFLQQSPPEMHDALTGIARALVRNLEDWSTPEPVLDAESGRVGYKENDEVNYDLSHPNKTQFAYLNFEMEGKLTREQVARHLGVDIVCGRFSFAEIPKDYRCILGVTGTLAELLEVGGIRDMLEKQYGFKHYTYAPSIFGERRLTFREAEHVSVLDSEADWTSRIESLLADERGRNNSVLVFFKNTRELEKFPGWQSFECLTERVDPQRRAGYVAAATSGGKVTLLTRAFGRGIDFQMPEGHEVVVMQTFLSSLVSEETQIKGRTARQGKPGQYRLVLCRPHLEAKGFSPEDVRALQAGNGEDVGRLLRAKQQARTQVKVAGMSERKEKAAQLERGTKEWEHMLFAPDVPAEQKLMKLAEWNEAEQYQGVHYTVLLDSSWSMSGQPWRDLTTAFSSFLQELLRDPLAAALTKVSVALFSYRSHVVEPTHARVAEVQQIGRHFACGGTNFGAAFDACRRVIGRSPPSTKELILFLTDGQARLPELEINALLAEHSKRIKGLTCIAFGADAGHGTLQGINQLFQDQGIPAKLTTPAGGSSLVQTFVEAASSRAGHF